MGRMTDPSTLTAGLYIFSAPSGGGKTSLARALAKDCVDVSISISYTTRSRRSGEKDGQDYFFVNCATFKKMIEQGDFLEYARVFDHYYGTPKKEISQAQEKDQTIFLEIDWQGAESIRKTSPGCLSIFIVPPSKQELKKRLTKRATDSADQIAHRYKLAVKDIEQYIHFDCVIINKDIDSTCREIMGVLDSSQNIKHNISNEALAIIKSFIGPQTENN